MHETQELTLDISQSIEIGTAIGDAYKALIHRLSGENSTPDNKPMPPSIVIAVVMANPCHLPVQRVFVAPLRREIEKLVGPDHGIQAPGVTGIAMKNRAVIVLYEGAETRGFGHGAYREFASHAQVDSNDSEPAQQ